MKKRFLLLVGSALVCGLLGGCGSVNSDDIESVVQEKLEVEDLNNVKEETTKEETAKEENTVEKKTILPLPVSIDMNQLDNCTVAISLEKGDAYVDDTGAMQMDVTVYTYDWYDMVDMAELKEGDIIIIRGQEIPVTSIERNERGILINGGLDNGGYDFATDDTTVWYECGYSDAKSYYALGDATIRVSADMNFYDSSDLDKGEVMYYPGDFLTDKAGIVYHFVPDNTKIVIENGKIIEMYRSYIP